jgi:hypothetical protein
MFDFVSSRDLPHITDPYEVTICHPRYNHSRAGFTHKERRGNAFINFKIHFVSYVPFVADKTGDFLIMSFRF